MDHEKDDHRILGLELGVVTDNADPKKLGRVRFRIEGLIEPQSNWALPFGGGGAQEGGFSVPRIGSTVGVLFYRGDPDVPFYMPGNWGEPGGASESPTPIKAPDVSAADAPEIKAFETKQWLITIDDRPDGAETFELRHKRTGDHITIDGAAPGVHIKGSAAVIIESTGLVKLKGLTVQINDRTVRGGTEPI